MPLSYTSVGRFAIYQLRTRPVADALILILMLYDMKHSVDETKTMAVWENDMVAVINDALLEQVYSFITWDVQYL